MVKSDEMAWLAWTAKVLAKPLAEAVEAIDGLPVPGNEEAMLRQRIARGNVVNVIRTLDEAERMIRGLRAVEAQATKEITMSTKRIMPKLQKRSKKCRS